MVHLNTVKQQNSLLVKQPLVAVFVGGTSGIGEYTLQALAATHASSGSGLRVYVVGRNATSAKRIFSDCRSVCPTGQFNFVKAGDLALLKDVDRSAKEIIRMEEEQATASRQKPKIDILVMTAAVLDFNSRDETTEGLDRKMSLLYYSRMRFILQLMPLLLTSPLPAHIISVFAAGMEDKLFPSDLSLRSPCHFTLANSRSHVVYMKTLFMERLAAQYPGRLSLTHVYPGLVLTEGFNVPSLPAWFKVTWKVVKPLARMWSVPAEECGQRILFLATPRYPAQQDGVGNSNDVATGSDGVRGSGAYEVNWNGEAIPNEKAYAQVARTELKEQVWQHTMKAFEEIESGGVFAQ